jgi:predicted ATPase
MLGRDVEVDEITAMLHTSALLTLVGPGGVGKTLLAMHVARNLVDDKRDGVWLVELAPAADRDQVVTAVTRALGLSDHHGGDPLDALVDACADLEMLVLLDNCEHVLDAAAEVADALLARGAGIGIIATSRESLQLSLEQQYPIEPLTTSESTVNDFATIAQSAAVQL